jgi:hypothetical protein
MKSTRSRGICLIVSLVVSLAIPATGAWATIRSSARVGAGSIALGADPTAVGTGSVALGSQTASGFRRLELTSESLRLIVTASPEAVFRADEDRLVILDRSLPEVPVAPDVSLPIACGWFAVRPGSQPSIRLESAESIPLPWPDSLGASDLERIRECVPGSCGSLGEETRIRNRFARRIRFCPVVTDDAGTLRYITRAIFRVSFPEVVGPKPPDVLRQSGSPAPLSKPPSRGPRRGPNDADLFLPFYEECFLNGDHDFGMGRPSPPGQESGLEPDPSQSRESPSDPVRPREPQSRDEYHHRSGLRFSCSPNPWIKLFTNREEIYQVSGRDLAYLGMRIADVDPLTIRMFAPALVPLPEDSTYRAVPDFPREIPITVRDGGDGTLDPDDRILFHGFGPDGFADDLGQPAPPAGRFLVDPYNREAVFWLTWGGTFPSPPLRIGEWDGSQTTPPYRTRGTYRVHLEENRIYNTYPFDRPGPSSAPWELFYWSQLQAMPGDREWVLRFSIADPLLDQPVRLRARFWGSGSGQAPWSEPDHVVQLRLNDDLTVRWRWDGYGHLDADTTAMLSYPGRQEVRMVVPLRDSPEGGIPDVVEFDWLELHYTRVLVARDDTLTYEADPGDGCFEIVGLSGTDPDLQILETDRPERPRWIRTRCESDQSGGFRARFRSPAESEEPARFLVRPGANRPVPRLEIDAPPPNGYLRERTDPVDMIVVTPRDFRSPAEELAAWRRTHFPGRDEAAVTVVDLEDVYDEFAGGRADPTALRNFLQFARDAWNGGSPEDSPAYVLLLGDAYYDPRDYLQTGQACRIPTHYGRFPLDPRYSPVVPSDDFYSLLDGPDDVGIDLLLGRLPAGAPAEAREMVAKTIAYEREPDPGPWRSRLLLTADDFCQGAKPDQIGVLHVRNSEDLATEFPTDLTRDKVYLLDYGVDCVVYRKPAARDDLIDRINDGVLILTYVGHASDMQLADERLFEVADIPRLLNRGRPFLFLAAACSPGAFDGSSPGLAESLVRAANGGAIASFAAVSIATSQGTTAVVRRAAGALWSGGDRSAPRPIGEAAAAGKQPYLGVDPRRYVLFGDPATVLAAPRDSIRIALHDAWNGRAPGDTLYRGQRVEMTGEVLDGMGGVDASFDGEAWVRFLDSDAHQIRVRSGSWIDSVAYFVNGSRIFSASVPVRAGRFATRWQLPRDLRGGDRGPARAEAYAERTGSPAIGGAFAALASLTIPDSAFAPPSDRIPPTVRMRVDGDPTALPPGATVSVALDDSSGIDVTALTPERSVLFRVESGGEILYSRDLTSEVSFGEDYRSGTVSCRLPEDLPLDSGFTLLLEASDNAGNRAAGRLDIYLAGSFAEDPALGPVFNMPNPMEMETGFYGEIARSAEIEVRIFTMTGRRIAHLGPQVLTPPAFAQQGLRWNGRDADGDRPANGVYLFTVRARPAAGGPVRTRLGRLAISR